jgi:tetraprenyl-beta-curcumene synthase
MISPSDTSETPARRRGGAAPVGLPVRQRAGLVPGVTGSLLLASVRYWRSVAPVVQRELAAWRRRADAIDDPQLRELALAKLDGERFNAEAGAMLATFAPAARRAEVVRAVVALQLLFDLLDGLTERPSQDPIADGERQFGAFTDAIQSSGRTIASPPPGRDAYLHELAAAVRGAVAPLPAWAAVAETAVANARRASQAQTHMHATALLGTDQLEQWARTQPAETGLDWRELSAGAASSVLVVHALIGAAADPATNTAQAAQIARAYLSTCVLLTLLDSLTDSEVDARAGERGYANLYDDPQQLARSLAALSGRAVSQARELPRPARHLMILTGVVAYYASAPGARGEQADRYVCELRRGLWPLISPALFLMRCWRLARRVGGRRFPVTQNGRED